MSFARAEPEMVFEPATGTVLYAVEPDRAWHPASVTKMMTAYVAFSDLKAGRVRLEDEVPLSTYARIQPASRIGLRAGIKINLEQALAGMVLRSANDFAVAVAERLSGDEGSFVQRMNETARRLGMTRTRYKNPHGLPHDEQVTTARDMALLTIALLRDFPERSKVFAMPSVQIHKGTFHNANDLLRTFEGADGMKTGFTCASGYNVVATATRNGHRLAAIVFGAANRQARSKRAARLLEAGFTFLQEQDLARTARATGAASTTAVTTAALAPTPAAHASAMQPIAHDATATAAIGKDDDDGQGKGHIEHAPAADTGGESVPLFRAIAIKDLALSPSENVPPHDAATDTRMRKCPGSGRVRHHRGAVAAKTRARRPHHRTGKVHPAAAARKKAGVKKVVVTTKSAATSQGDKTD
ncbi:MAG: D-alanyl-D-alanine carboxypeptidase family protein [Hyphomicrobiaceae bacterium]